MLPRLIREMTIREKTARALELLSGEEATSGQAAQVSALLARLDDRDMNVTVIGQFKRGKSRLSNRILEAEVLPVGIVPITSAVTKVKYGAPDAEVRFRNGVAEQVPFGELSSYISEQENQNNEKGVAEVILHTPSAFLAQGLTFIDTPGVGSFHRNNTEVAYDNMKESDAVIFLLSVDSPINQIEIDFLRSTKDFAAKFYFAVNKIDTVSEAELKMYTDYCGMLLRKLMGREDITLFPVSAKTGEGVEALKAQILEDCNTHAREIMEDSCAKKLADVIHSAVTQLDFYWKAMNLEYKELDERFGKVDEELEDVKARAQQCEGNYMLRLNEYKLELSDCVRELFGMAYHYDIDMLRIGLTEMEKADFLAEVEALCGDLKATLDRILLYREENAYKVCHRINAINRLARELRRIADTL